ncbi:acyl-CoA dehydrogenase family protein [Numidum massiliense]|uniref:acyl-CoA dehydrogenase n=1 Tax=Numidum massiliense TaxID=1522315 RepID=UPI0006D5B0E4|nr:acyl-CoA dehydrogenase [Numidum massiliense]
MFNEEIVTEIREQSLKMEQAGVLTPQVLDFIYEQGLFKLFVPRELGGKMTALPKALQIFEEAAWIDGSFGWLVNIGSGGGYFTSWMLPSVSQKLFQEKQAVIAGSGYPSGTAKKVAGGYLVSGRWKYCSGSTHATLFTANCLVENSVPSPHPSIRSFIFLPEQVNIVKDWNAFGLKATASHTITVEHVFVPDDMTFDILSVHTYFDDPIFRYPFVLFAETSFATVAIGICRHLIDEAKVILEQKREAWDSIDTSRYPFVMGKVKEMERFFQQTVADFYEIVDRSWEMNVNRQLTSETEIQRQVSEQCKRMAKTALHCAEAIFPYLGMPAVMAHTPVNRIWRDLHTACQHTMLVPFYDLAL